MWRRMAVGLSIALAALLLLTQVVVPHSRKPKLRADADAILARLEKGREIIRRACEVVGGLDEWQSKRDVSFRLNNQWYLPMSFWPEKKVETIQHYLLRREIGRVEMQTEKGVRQWGLFKHKPWALLNGQIDSEGVKSAGYVITQFSYFFELPFKFLDAGAYPEFVGEEIIDGKVFEKVYVSFGLNVGKYPTDWYLAYFDHSSGRLHSIIYTSLDKSPSFMEYLATFDDYQIFDGISIPTKMTAKMSRPVAGIKIHDWQISDVRFDTGVTETFFQMPDAATASASARMSMQ